MRRDGQPGTGTSAHANQRRAALMSSTRFVRSFGPQSTGLAKMGCAAVVEDNLMKQ
jgi:hypothetical protein